MRSLSAGEGSAAAKARVAADPARCGVAKVIGYSKLKANYKAHEARRRLCASYDLFLSDDRILPLLPKLLGKAFFKKKKQPIPVDLAREDWGAAVRRATSGAYFFVSAGGCSAVRVARAGQTPEEVAANALAAAEGVAARIPKGWKGIRAMYLKTNASVSLPIYTALPDASEAAAAGAEAPPAAAKAPKPKPKGGDKGAAAKPAAAPAPAAKPKPAAAAAPAKAKAKAAPAAAAAAPAAAPAKKRGAADAAAPPAKRAAAAKGRA
jgi:ribosome biogenesis protein UTP30